MPERALTAIHIKSAAKLLLHHSLPLILLPWSVFGAPATVAPSPALQPFNPTRYFRPGVIYSTDSFPSIFFTDENAKRTPNSFFTQPHDPPSRYFFDVMRDFFALREKELEQRIQLDASKSFAFAQQANQASETLKNPQSLPENQREWLEKSLEAAPRKIALYDELHELTEKRLKELPRLELLAYQTVLNQQLLRSAPPIARSPAVAMLFAETALRGGKVAHDLKEAGEGYRGLLNTWYSDNDECYRLAADPEELQKNSIKFKEMCDGRIDKLPGAVANAYEKVGQLAKSQLDLNFYTAKALIKSKIVNPLTGEVNPRKKAADALEEELVRSIDPTKIVPSFFPNECEAALTPLKRNLPSGVESFDLGVTLFRLKRCYLNTDNCSVAEMEPMLRHAEKIIASWGQRDLDVPLADQFGYALVVYQARAAIEQKRDALITVKVNETKVRLEEFKTAIDRLSSKSREHEKAIYQFQSPDSSPTDIQDDMDLLGARYAAVLRELDCLVQEGAAQGYLMSRQNFDSIQGIADETVKAAVDIPNQKYQQEVVPAWAKWKRQLSTNFDLKFLQGQKDSTPFPEEAAKAMADIKLANEQAAKFGVAPDLEAVSKGEALVRAINQKAAALQNARARESGGSKWYNPFTWFNQIPQINSQDLNSALPEESPSPIPDRKPGFSEVVPLEKAAEPTPLTTKPDLSPNPPLPSQTITPRG